MIALVILAGLLAFIVFEMANAPVILESQREAKYVTDRYLTSLTAEDIEYLRSNKEARQVEIRKLGVYGWEYDELLRCEEFINLYILNYPI